MILGISRVTPVEKIRTWPEALTGWRPDFHAHPNLCFQEVRTSTLVAARLPSWGTDVNCGIATNGLVWGRWQGWGGG